MLSSLKFFVPRKLTLQTSLSSRSQLIAELRVYFYTRCKQELIKARSEIEGLFDTQVDAILKLIDRQLGYLQADHLGETVVRK